MSNKKVKVFGVGFHKTGTTTLNAVLKELGYNVCSNRLELASDLLEEDYSKVDKLFEQYDAFEDNPWPLLYQYFDKQFPDSKYILTIRDEDKWWNSVLNHFGEHKSLMRKWIYGVESPLGNEELFRNKFREHNSAVRAYFKNRPNCLLEIDWSKSGGSWGEVCSFLGQAEPKTPFPHKNKLAYTKNGKIIQKMKLIYYKNFVKPFKPKSN